MNTLDPGLTGYLVLLMVALFAHEPWRWAGLLIGRHIDANGDVFRWVRAVSTALVAALVSRQVLFPPGALASVPWWGRVGGFLVAVLAFLLGGRKLIIGIASGAGVLIAAKLVSG